MARPFHPQLSGQSACPLVCQHFPLESAWFYILEQENKPNMDQERQVGKERQLIFHQILNSRVNSSSWGVSWATHYSCRGLVLPKSSMEAGHGIREKWEVEGLSLSPWFVTLKDTHIHTHVYTWLKFVFLDSRPFQAEMKQQSELIFMTFIIQRPSKTQCLHDFPAPHHTHLLLANWLFPPLLR